MWAAYVFFLACSLASSLGQDSEPACDGNAIRNGGDDDRCQLLQAGVGLVTHHEAGHADANAKNIGHDDGVVEDANDDFPNILKKITSAFGGVKTLEDDFKGIKAEVKAFAGKVADATKDLLAGINSKMTLQAIVKQIEATYKKVHAAAEKLVTAIKKVISDFLSGVGQVAPPEFKKAMNATLVEITAEAQKFSDSFKKGEDGMKDAERLNTTFVCQKVSHSLDTLKKMATEFMTKALELSENGMNKELKQAYDLMPAAIKKKIDELFKEANDAVEHLEGSVGTTVKDFKHAIAGALKGHCEGLDSAAPRLQVGILTAMVVGVFGMTM